MKAKVFNRDNACQYSRESRPSISINPRGGVINFTLGFCEGAKIPKEPRLDFIQNELHPKDWYVRLADSDGFPARSNGSGGHMVYSTVICKYILEALEVDDMEASYRMQISTVPTEDETLGTLYAILTKSATKLLKSK
ncbi:MAG: hypothetical protein WBO10_01980 [Pyrinomonadaceae bacterium]